MRLHANSPTRTKWICAASISDRSASQRDSGHCSGYHAAPSNSDGEYGVVGTCAATGTDKEINKAKQIATFLNITVFSILSSMIVSFVSISERHSHNDSVRSPLVLFPERLQERLLPATLRIGSSQHRF